MQSLPSYIDGAPPWTPTNRGHGITSWPLKHDPEVPPRDCKELHTDTYQTYTNNQALVTDIMHKNLITILVTNPHLSYVESIPTRCSQTW